MKQQTKFFKTGQTTKLVDRRGKERTIKHYVGMNKGKPYPYRSKKRGG